MQQEIPPEVTIYFNPALTRNLKPNPLLNRKSALIQNCQAASWGKQAPKSGPKDSQDSPIQTNPRRTNRHTA